MAGCASSSRNYTQLAQQSLHPGMTSAEVIKALGKPGKTAQTASQKTLAYYYSWQKDPRYTDPNTGYDGPTSVQLLSVRYDASGKLEEFLISDGAIIGNQKVRGGTDAGNYVPAPNVPGISNISQTELVKRYGQPSGKSIGAANHPAYHWLFIGTSPTGAVETKELIVAFTSSLTVESAVVNENLPVPSKMFSLAPIQTQQPDFFRRDVVPPDAVKSFF